MHIYYRIFRKAQRRKIQDHSLSYLTEITIVNVLVVLVSQVYIIYAFLYKTEITWYVLPFKWLYALSNVSVICSTTIFWLTYIYIT